jgi:transposase
MTAEQRACSRRRWPRTRPACRRSWPNCKRGLPEVPKTPRRRRAKPRRQALPEHLRASSTATSPRHHLPTPECGQPMQRIGEDVSEKLDIVPAEFFVHRHIYGKWACRCCQTLRQEPAEPDVVDGGIPPAAGGAHADQPLRRPPAVLPAGADQRPLGVHTPRSTLAAWAGAGGAALEPLYERTSASCWAAGCCTPTRHRSRCWTLGLGQDEEGLHLGLGAQPSRSARRAWSTSSAWDAGRSTPWPSWAARDRRRMGRRWHGTCSPTSTRLQRRAGRQGVPAAQDPRPAPHMLGATSRNSARAQLPAQVAEEAMRRWARIYHDRGRLGAGRRTAARPASSWPSRCGTSSRCG